MPIYTPSGFLDITNATLRTSNIESQNINFTSSGGSISVGPAFDFQQVSAIGNTTPETIQFTNATTSFVTSGNVEVGKNISVVDATVSSNMSVGGNVTVSSNLSVSGNVTIGKNLFLTSNTTTSINSNVIVEHSGPHPREPTTPLLKKFPEIDFDASKMDGNDTANTYVQAGYVVTASSQSSGSEVWRLFDDGDWNQEAIVKYPSPTFQYNPTSNPNSLGGVSGEWFKVKFPRKVIINKFTLNVGDSINNGLVAFKVLGSDDDTNWTEVKDVSGLTSASYTTAAPFVTTVESVSSVAYRYYAVVITRLLGVNQVSIREVEFYGYEEDLPVGDTSLDTTFTSILNRPQTSGVKVYVDGDTLDNKVTGPPPTGTDATYDSTGKFWTLTGALTSNVTLEANTFLEGDAPHSVSMWFNSSNLEANVSNTCVFSVSDQEKLDSQNLDLQSNTWHNLTYAYQGEGGSRVTYLDGRKVSEDQAEDTFGEYPPFGMTGYSQGGYVVSASDEDTTYPLWRIFAGDSDFYVSSTSAFPGGVYTSGSTYNLGTNSGGSATDNGHWIKLAVPYKLKISHVNIDARTGYEPQAPKNFKFYGSNDDTNWEQIGPSFSNEAPQDDGTSYYTLNSTKAYKYIGLVVTETVGNGNGRLGLQQLKFYGHRENDLVRLPDPTNVLKYPHIVMTGPAQRGYVASESSTHKPNGIPRPAHQAFNGVTGDDGWGSFDGGYFSATGLIDGAPTHPEVSEAGEWIQIQLPHKLLLDNFTLSVGTENGTDRDQARYPKEFKLYGYDGSSWAQIGSDYLTAKQTSGGQVTTYDVTTTTYYYKFLIIIKKTWSITGEFNGLSTLTQIGEWELYGTEEATPVPIQIGGGNIDKVANFRVYDKFVGEDQALEIWDAQKDEFGRAKSSMTLHKGRLGIGTTEPEGRLAILDEPHNLEEFPPRAMTDYKTYFEGHGEFCASASNTYQTGVYESYKAFNKNSTGGTYTWWSQSDIASVPTYSTSTGEFSSTDSSYSTNVESGTKYGHWLQIEFPYKINYKYSEIEGAHNSIGRQPRAGYILGSNDLTGMWTSLHNFTNVTRTHAYESVRYTPPTVSTQTFKYFRLVIEELNGDQYAGIARWDIFGTREQRQSVLHDGQLTLTKNLDVPRIGPPLDADDTPRRDRLVVEYNTSSNPTFEGAVRDTSGRGNDGVFYGTDMNYSSADKAFVFNGTDDYIYGGVGSELPTGDAIYSLAAWVNLVPSFTTYATIINFGSVWGPDTMGNLTITPSYQIVSGIGFGGDFVLSANAVITPNTWHHVAAVKKSTGTCNVNMFDLYVDGALIADKVLVGGTRTQSIGSTVYFAVGGGFTGDPGNMTHGLISNPKLYDTALTASEVKTLYDMGRNGSVANPQPLHIAAPLYAPGVPVQIVSKVYKKQASYGSTSAYRNIKELDISIKPRFANSRILLHWMINGELHQDNVIRVARDGSYIIHGYNQTQGTSRWSGIAAAMFDQNESSTPHNFCIDTYDEPGGTNTYNYQIYIGSSSSTSYPAFINRTYDSAGTNAYEAGICFMSATEIAQ